MKNKRLILLISLLVVIAVGIVGTVYLKNKISADMSAENNDLLVKTEKAKTCVEWENEIIIVDNSSGQSLSVTDWFKSVGWRNFEAIATATNYNEAIEAYMEYIDRCVIDY